MDKKCKLYGLSALKDMPPETIAALKKPMPKKAKKTTELQRLRLENYYLKQRIEELEKQDD